MPCCRSMRATSSGARNTTSAESTAGGAAVASSRGRMLDTGVKKGGVLPPRKERRFSIRKAPSGRRRPSAAGKG
ncbi:hypothetical protein [Sorangium sp. So ce124]|uniref:hypothetical protein n=1 Tax=Sorangium sp. So ce124 TaxID=3133280 RepID=UPI003F5E8BD1